MGDINLIKKCVAESLNSQTTLAGVVMKYVNSRHEINRNLKSKK